MIKYYKLVLLCIVGIFLTSCDNDDDKKDLLNLSSKPIVIVACEGIFQKGNASVDLILEDNTVAFDPFTKVNGRPIGDVAQSLTIIDGKIFAALNNSQKIEVIDLKTFKSLATILHEGQNFNPQYIVKISDNEAAVSDMWSNSIRIIDTKTSKVTGEIPVSMSSTRQMLVVDDKLFVSLATQKIVVISLATRKVIEELPIPVVANSNLLQDRDGNIWAITSEFEFNVGGNVKPLSQPSLHCIDPRTYEVKKTIVLGDNFTVSRYGAKLEMNKTKNQLYLTAIVDPVYSDWSVAGDEGVFKISISDTSFPTEPLFYYSNKVQSPYNMVVSPDETIFVCDALDYQQRGWVYEFDQKGAKLNEYKVGIVPQYIQFINE